LGMLPLTCSAVSQLTTYYFLTLWTHSEFDTISKPVLQFGIMPFNRVHYGWIIVFAGAGIMSATSFAPYTFGVFLKPLVLDFGWDRGPLSLVPSIILAAWGLSSIVTGKLSDIYGPRILCTLGGIFLGAGFVLMAHVTTLTQIYVCWGLLPGLATGCCLTPIVTTIPRWFTQKTGLALGIPFAGVGAGALVAPILAQVFVTAFGWRNAFIILGIVAWAIMIPLAQLLRKDPAQMGRKAYGETVDIQGTTTIVRNGGLSLKESMRTFPFWIFATTQFMFMFCLQAIMAHVVPHATDSGIAAIAAAGILSIIAGISIAGKLSMGFIADKIGAVQSLLLCLLLTTLALVWLFFAKEIWAFYIFALAFGLAYGGTATLAPLTSSELFGVKSLGIIFGVLSLCTTIGGALGPATAGYTFDMTGSYNTALIVMATISMIATVLGLVLLKYRRKSKRDY
jgi:OFA family oxalate/formate antiporter-like MFS transporter